MKINNKKLIAVTGISGVIGQELIKKIRIQYDVIGIIHDNLISDRYPDKHIRLNLFDTNKIRETLKHINPDYFIHLAAMTHIDNCEIDKVNGKNGLVWKTNVDATREIATYCSKNRIPLIYLSTECVFEGKKEFYEEYDKKYPINWYGYTKSEAENILLATCEDISIVRSVVAYHKNDDKKTLYGKILDSLMHTKQTNVVTNQKFTPTYTQDIVKALLLVVKNKFRGIYHIVPNISLSPYDFAEMIAIRNGFLQSNLRKVTLNEYFGLERASLRLKNSCLLGTKSNKILEFLPSLPENII